MKARQPAARVYPQPAWQRSVSEAASTNGMRGVPDVALSAAAHDGYIIYENGSYWIVSGTSAGAPAFAGIAAIMTQANGGAGQGNLNPALYKMLTAPENPFHRTLAGDNSVPGVVGFSANDADYNFATGLGSIDVDILVRNWSRAKVKAPPLPSRATPIPISIHRRP
jgi:pseudomonalisin